MKNIEIRRKEEKYLKFHNYFEWKNSNQQNLVASVEMNRDEVSGR